MKVLFLFTLLLLLASCAKQHLYRFPSENERKQYRMEDLKWSYIGTIPDTITVTDGDRLYRLPVTDKTKLEVYTTSNEKFRFILQSIVVTQGAEFFGSDQIWRGYDQLSHAERTIGMREIARVVVVSDVPATTIIR